MSDTEKEPEKEPESAEDTKPEVDEEAEKAARLASAKKRLQELKKQQKKKNKKKTETSPHEPEAESLAESSPKSPNPDTPATETSADPEHDKTTSTSISPVQTDTSLDTIKEQQAESEKRIKDLENKLAQANSTIDELQQEVSTYKSQLEQFAEEGPGPQVKSTPSEVTKPISEAPEEVAKLTLQIESLKVENNFLSDKVYTLETRVANLLSANKKSAIDFPRDASDFESDIASLSSPVLESRAETARYSAGQQPRVASFAEMDLYTDVSKIRNINQEMDRWKGWQVDMRGWRTLGIGPVFAV